MVDDQASENGEQEADETAYVIHEIVYVMFTGSNRTTYTGIPVDVYGWWEIHGLTWEGGRELAYALGGDRHMIVDRRPTMEGRLLTSGCVYMVIAGPPNVAKARAGRSIKGTS